MIEIPLEELVRIGKEIERTPPDFQGDVSNTEFVWLYTPGEPLRQLEKDVGETAALYLDGSRGVMIEDYTATNEVALVQNHPSGYVMPTLDDLNALLGGVVRGENIKFLLTASSQLGKVTGFCELKFNGERRYADFLMGANDDIYREHLDAKYGPIDESQFARAKIGIGDRLLSPKEYDAMVYEAMITSSITGRVRPLEGYKLGDLGFVPEGE